MNLNNTYELLLILALLLIATETIVIIWLGAIVKSQNITLEKTVMIPSKDTIKKWVTEATVDGIDKYKWVETETEKVKEEHSRQRNSIELESNNKKKPKRM